ncbi:5-formyltetrahydrofolate cyclo-ligase [Apilactobacillus xinyiensis]|uniref:5-formyltetrahydrofolate cyclo-ligase n=1 Tax=Apilactobacillus xinyiensis TaxID=2841032 RepID=UPI003364E387
MDKKQFRKTFLDKLNVLNISKKDCSSLYKKLFESKEFSFASTIAVTLNSKIEINTLPIIHKCWKMGKKVVIPKTFPNRKMFFYIYNENTKLVKSKFGILEPINSQMVLKDEIDLMIVPGLCFDKLNHYRLGFGGGYYDRFLSNYNGYTISLATKHQLLETPEWVVDDFDKQINKIIY